MLGTQWSWVGDANKAVKPVTALSAMQVGAVRAVTPKAALSQIATKITNAKGDGPISGTIAICHCAGGSIPTVCPDKAVINQ
jgi:hypothetical protein